MTWAGWIRQVLGSALFAAGTACAMVPPLPGTMPVDDSVERYDATPLPDNGRGVDAVDLSSDGQATADASSAAAVDATARASAGGNEAGGAQPAADAADAGMPSPAAPATAAARDDARAPALEGPPIPLAPPQRLAGGSGRASDDGFAPDRPITLNFRHADLDAVLAAFAQFTGLNIVASERVRGNVTLRLNRVPWRNAFNTLLDVNGLAMEQHGNVLWVAPLAELAARERQRFETHARMADLEPLASRMFELHYARAEDVRRMLAGSGNQRVLSKRGAATADPRTNLLFVTDLDARVAQIADLLAALDRPSRQVLIEARIVEGDQGFSRNLGTRMALAATAGDGSTPTGFTGGSDGSLYDLSARPLSGFDAATAGMTLFAARATRLLNVELSALEAEGHGQTISSPRVVTADRMKAVVEQGTELPYQAKVGQGVSGVQFRRASLKLEVEPQITPDGQVVLDLDVAKDSVGEQTAAGPAVNTKHVHTRVEVENGGTVSIGGIYATDERDDVTRVPLLGKIPVLGALFRHLAHRDQRSELVVFITPRVVPPD
jgi:type IV pilus assembly protein PilQ